MKTIKFTLLLALVFLSTKISATDFNARQIIEHLYKVTPQQTPINDMVIEMEDLVPNVCGGCKNPNQMLIWGKGKIYFKAPMKFRIEITVSDPGGPMDHKKAVIIRDGENVWQQWYPLEKKKCSDRLVTIPHVIPFGIVYYPQDIEGNGYRIISSEEIEKVGTTVIAMTSPANPQEELSVWVDTSRWIPLKILHENKGNQGNHKIEVLYKDIRKTKDGRFFPFKIEKYVNQALSGIVTYTSISFNVGLRNTVFELPKKK